jgi:hypothetical protein
MADGLQFGTWGTSAATWGMRDQQPLVREAYSNLDIQNVFAALQGYYASNPIGSIEIRNVDDIEVTDVSVLFDQPHWMDAPTPLLHQSCNNHGVISSYEHVYSK